MPPEPVPPPIARASALVVALALTACGGRPASVATKPSSIASDGERTTAQGWEVRATLPKRHREVSWLTSTPEGLVISASTDALNEDGAAVFRLADGTLTTLLESDGQGFLRVYATEHGLLVPDADAAFGIEFFARLDVDGVVFTIDPDGGVSEEILPAVYHVFDVAELDGRLYASTGAYVPGDLPYRSERAPAALLVRGPAGEPWQRVVEYPPREAQPGAGVIRFTYLFAHDHALLAGVSDWTAGSHAVRIEGLPAAPRITRIDGLTGGTRQWGSGGDGRIYHLGDDTLSVSDDGGLTFEPVATPDAPQGFVWTGTSLLVVAAGALWRSEDDVAFRAVLPANPALGVPASDLLAVPLVVYEQRLWTASARTGEIFEAERGVLP